MPPPGYNISMHSHECFFNNIWQFLRSMIAAMSLSEHVNVHDWDAVASPGLQQAYACQVL